MTSRLYAYNPSGRLLRQTTVQAVGAEQQLSLGAIVLKWIDGNGRPLGAGRFVVLP